MDKQETIALEQEYVLGVYSRPPFVLAGGKGSTLFDTDGNQYIDCVSGIAVNSLGYNDPGINQAVQEATSTGMFHVSNLYHTEP
ncbi:MAG: aminotransferase class III-fold pyridoxal phosphate-dependent enzyme, partial [Caldilineaceae bacterium]|nr:aminotransferase class III-fold pyridoxal phosphate-dependent enzyme [Caldilineaceae bacterium]